MKDLNNYFKNWATSVAAATIRKTVRSEDWTASSGRTILDSKNVSRIETYRLIISSSCMNSLILKHTSHFRNFHNYYFKCLCIFKAISNENKTKTNMRSTKKLNPGKRCQPIQDFQMLRVELTIFTQPR